MKAFANRPVRRPPERLSNGVSNGSPQGRKNAL